MSDVRIGTGLSYGHAPYPGHAARAVEQALARAGRGQANSVLLLLTPEYAAQPDPAIRAAARAAGCMQIVGCIGNGLITDEDWVLDSPGAAAMVFTGDVCLAPMQEAGSGDAVLSLCTPAGLTAEWLDAPVCRIGAVSADVVANTPFAVWSGGRVADGGQVDAVVSGARSAITVSQGVRALTAPIEVAEVQGYEVVRLGNYPALNVLVKSLPGGVQDMDEIPLHMLIGGVTIGDPDTAIRDGRFRLNHIIGANPDNRSITLARPLNQGERLFWAMRDALASERDMHDAVDRAEEMLDDTPEFALMFPCVGRGPSFYGNRDRDVELLKTRYPGLPFIGCYASGEIGPLDGENALHQYSTVLGLFSPR